MDWSYFWWAIIGYFIGQLIARLYLGWKRREKEKREFKSYIQSIIDQGNEPAWKLKGAK